MFKRLWLVFAQVVTVCVAALFTLSTLRPEWLSRMTNPLPAAGAMLGIPLAATPPASAPRAGNGSAQPASYAIAAKRALPSVVKVATSAQRRSRNTLLDDPEFQRFFGRQRSTDRAKEKEDDAQPLGEGSGVLIRADGYILTNNHVVDGATQIQVELSDKRVFPAKIIGTDADTDLAVIKIEGTDFPAITIADSQALSVGDVVLAIGNPFGVFGNTVTMGIVSALGRTQISDVNPFESFIQTDAAINQGNSGGALVNTSGELIGINSSIFTRTGDFSGIGFAIPTALAKPILEQLIATGAVKRGYLGINVGEITPEIVTQLKLQNSNGALVAAVLDGAPGARAGLRAGDVIIEINGKPIIGRNEAVNTIAAIAPDITVPLKVLRGGEVKEIKVTLGKRPNRK